jgi:hypothetical protein
MTHHQPDGSDPIDAGQHPRTLRGKAWTDHAVAPHDFGPVVPVTSAGVRGRRSVLVPGGRLPLLAAVALVTALVLAGIALRTGPAQTGQASPDPNGSVATQASTDASVAVPTEPIDTASESSDPTALPTPQPPSAAATASATHKPLKTSRPDPGATDSDHTDWTPPPGFVGTVTISNWCLHADGTEEVMVEADFNSPVEVTQVELYLDGIYFGRGGPAVGEELVGSVIVGHDLGVGTRHVPMAKFFRGQFNTDLIAKIVGASFLVAANEPCPGG